jgi:hypothetical protein
MTLSTLPTFLTFLAQALCFPVPANDPWHGLEIPPYPRRERLGSPTVGPEANDLTGRPESASEVAMASVGACRLGAVMTCLISPRRHPVHGRRLAGLGRRGTRCRPRTISVSDMAVSAGKKPQG